MSAVIYIHGKGGSAAEAAHYRALFPDLPVYGIDYRVDTPWEAGREIREQVKVLAAKHERLILIANSIGAYFALHAGIEDSIEKAFFISPIVDMETLILGLMAQSGVTEKELAEKGCIPTAFGEELSWEYLQFVRTHPIRWRVPATILYGENDSFTPYETMKAFALKHGAALCVMPGGEHWFHTEEQMRFLDRWIKNTE